LTVTRALAVRELLGARELLSELTMREVRARYRGTVLGQLWSLINPLATMIIYTVVFGVLLRVQIPPGDPSGLDVFAVWLLCALLPWGFFSACVFGGMGALVGNAGLVQKVWFPREVLVVSNVLSWLVTLAFELVVLLAVLVVFGQPQAILWATGLVPVIVLLVIFSTGIGLLLSVLSVYFRDTGQLMGIVMQVWFYATPIVYPERLVPERFRWLYGLNPMERFVSCFRRLLYDGQPLRWQDLLAITIAATVSIVVGYLVFQRFEPRLAEEL
jgi:ABC-type polysaccharide/polyol phosphate export permease